MKKAVIVLFIIVLIIATLFIFDDNTNTLNNETYDENQVNIQDTEGIIDDYYLNIKSFTISKNTDNKDIIIIDIEWKNNSSESQAFIYTSLYYSAYQNGNELEDLSHYGENEYDYEGYNLKDLEIAPGNSKQIKIAYLLEDTASEVSFKITDSDEKNIVQKNFIIK